MPCLRVRHRSSFRGQWRRTAGQNRPLGGPRRCGTPPRDAGWAHDADGAPRRITARRRSRPAARPHRSLGLAVRGGGRHHRDRRGRPGRLRRRSGWCPGAGRRFHDHQPAPGGAGQLGQGNPRHGRQARAARDHHARRAGAVRAGGPVGAAPGVRRRSRVRRHRGRGPDRRADQRSVLDPRDRPHHPRSARRVSAAAGSGDPVGSLVRSGRRPESGRSGPGSSHLPDLDRSRRGRRDGRGCGRTPPGGHRGCRRGSPFAVPAADPDPSRPGAHGCRAG